MSVHGRENTGGGEKKVSVDLDGEEGNNTKPAVFNSLKNKKKRKGVDISIFPKKGGTTEGVSRYR